MYVYSGNCRQGLCGDLTPLVDFKEERLYVGDIVLSSSIDTHGIWANYGLTVVVSSKYISFSNGTYETKEDGKCFVMGIAEVDFMGKDKDRWRVEKVKSYKDVVDGEHWKNFGFRYSNI